MSENEKNTTGNESEIPGQQGSSNSNTGSPTEAELRYRIESRIRYNVFVHEDYAAHYRNLEKATSLFSMVLGTVALLSLAFPKLAIPMAAVSAISLLFSLLAIVYEFGPRAGEYSNATRIYNNMLSRIQIAETREQREAIENEYANFDVPGKINNVTQAYAYCRACLQLGCLEQSDFKKIGFWTYHTRFILPHRMPEILTRSGKKKANVPENR